VAVKVLPTAEVAKDAVVGHHCNIQNYVSV